MIHWEKRSAVEHSDNLFQVLKDLIIVTDIQFGIIG